MKPSTLNFISLLLLIVGTAFSASSQNIPQGIQYQSVFYGADGKLIANKPIGLRFRITDGTGSTVYWQEDQSATTNQYGLISIVIGTGTKSGGSAASFSAIDWGSSKAKIEVLADVNGGTSYVSMGNNALWSVPYALYAAPPQLNLEDLKNVSKTAPATGDVVKWNGTTWAPGKDNIGSTGSIKLSDLTDVSVNSPGTGQALKWNGSAWVAQNDLQGASKLTDLTDVNASSPTTGYVLKWNGTQWVPQVDFGAQKMKDLQDVNVSSLASGQVLKWNGTTWVPQADDKGAVQLSDLTDVSITSVSKGQVLKYNGTKWAPGTDDTAKSTGSSVWKVSGKNIYYSGGNVGFNLSSPAFRIHAVDTVSSSRATSYYFNTRGNTSSSTSNFNGGLFEINGTQATNIAITGSSLGSSSGLNIGISGMASKGVSNYGTEGFAINTNSNSSGLNLGVFGKADSASNTSVGVEGDAVSANGFVKRGVLGYAAGTGTSATGSANFGLYGYASQHSALNWGTYGTTDGTGTQNTGVAGISSGTGGTYNVGILGSAANATNNYAGYFFSDVYIGGTLSKAAGSFKIDHPLDPANKFLIHSFVESPDMMNVYNGNITTDATGTATVTLPSYFQTLNKDFRYQLTVIGDFAQAIVGKEIENNSFVIKTDKPNIKVSWQVTGIRQDPYAKAHPIVPEVEKNASEKGKYLHPELYGQPADKAILVDPAAKKENIKPAGSIK